MASTNVLKDQEKRHEILYRSIISSTGTTSTTGSIQLPDGAYHLFFFGAQSAGATTDPTLVLKAFVNKAQTAANAIPLALTTDTAYAASVDLELAQAELIGSAGTIVAAQGANTPVPVPYGLQYVYTKGEATAIDLTLMAVRAG